MRVRERLAREFLETYPREAAAVLERLPSGTAPLVLRDQPPVSAARVLEGLSTPAGAACLASLPVAAAAAAVAELAPDLAALLMRRVAVERRTAIMAALPERMAAGLDARLSYPAGTAGALMDPRAAALPRDLSVGHALRRIRRAPEAFASPLFIVDAGQTLVGVLSFHELVLAPRSAPLAAVMRTDVLRLAAYASGPTIAAHPGWHRLRVLPVVDERGRFLGVVRQEATLDLVPPGGATGPGAIAALLALGELWWLGLGRLVAGLGGVEARGEEPPRPEESVRGG